MLPKKINNKKKNNKKKNKNNNSNNNFHAQIGTSIMNNDCTIILIQ